MRYRIDGTVVDTDKATAHWDEARRWDGHNHISVATGSQWDHEDLYRSRKGRYYVVHSSQWEGRLDSAEWISREEAARWLLANDHAIPTDLAEAADAVSE